MKHYVKRPRCGMGVICEIARMMVLYEGAQGVAGHCRKAAWQMVCKMEGLEMINLKWRYLGCSTYQSRKNILHITFVRHVPSKYFIYTEIYEIPNEPHDVL